MGREHLLARLQHDLECGTLRGLMLTGEPGIGKTSAAAHLAEQLRARGWPVLQAACRPDMLPLGVFRGFLEPGPDEQPDPIEQALATLERGLTVTQRNSAVAREVARSKLFSGLTRKVVERVGGDRCALFVDDLQWCDPHSLSLLLDGLRGQPAWVLIATFSGAPLEGAVVTRADDVCLRIDRGTLVELSPLLRDDVGRYLERALGENPDASWVDALHQRSGGHPLYLRELVQALVQRGADLRTGTAAGQLDGVLPPLLRELIRQRAEQLTPGARVMAANVSILEAEFDVVLAAAVCECEREEALARFDELRNAGILEQVHHRPGHCQFVHGLMRQAFSDGLSSAQRARLHMRAAAVLQQRASGGVGAALIASAHHLHEALPISSAEEVVRAYHRAARWAAAQGGHMDSAKLHERAFQVAEQYAVGSPRDRLANALSLGRAYLACGFKDKTLAAYGNAIDGARSLGRSRALVAAVLGHTAALGWGRHTQSSDERLLLEALALVPPASAACARLTARRAVLRCHRGITAQEIDMAREAVRLAEPYRDGRDPRAWIEANGALHFALQGQAHRQERSTVARRLLALEDEHGLSENTYSIRHILAGERLMHGDRAGHDALLAQAERSASQHPQFAWLHQVACVSRDLMMGRWQAAELGIGHAAQLGAQNDNDQAKPAALGQMFLMRRAQGRAEELRPHFEALGDALRWLGDYPEAGLAAFYVAVGELDRARERFVPMVTGWLERPASNNDWLITAVELAGTCVALGDRERGVQLEACLLPHATLHAVHPGVNYYAGPVARYLGLLAALAGRHREAETWLRKAEAACETIGASAMRETVAEDLRRLAQPGGPALQAQPDGPALQVGGQGAHASAGGAEAGQPSLVRRGDGWALCFGGQEIYTRPLLGIRYLAELLAQPHQGIPARALVELQAGQGMPTRTGAAERQDLTLEHNSDAGMTTDKRALSAYRNRLRALEEDLLEAQERCDVGHLERLQQEREGLRAELSRALDLFGRPRKVGGRDERARVSCTRAIRKAIALLAEQHSALGEHLEASVRTGHECVYKPVPDLAWHCER